jgi:hypothetical protein
MGDEEKRAVLARLDSRQFLRHLGTPSIKLTLVAAESPR